MTADKAMKPFATMLLTSSLQHKRHTQPVNASKKLHTAQKGRHVTNAHLDADNFADGRLRGRRRCDERCSAQRRRPLAQQHAHAGRYGRRGGLQVVATLQQAAQLVSAKMLSWTFAAWVGLIDWARCRQPSWHGPIRNIRQRMPGV